MAESLVNVLLPKLSSFIDNVVQYREEVISMRAELERICAFLKVADYLEETDGEVKVWVNQIRDIAYDIEDALDEFRLLLGHDHGAGPSGVSGLIHRMSCCVLNFKARYRIANELQRIHGRLKSVCESHRRLRSRFSRAEQMGTTGQDMDENWQDHRGNALLIDKSDLVGIEEPKKQIMEWLVEGGSGRQVVSVVGMGGLGKSTLVKQVFEEPAVKKHFTVSEWITLSRSSDIEVLLKELLQQLARVVRKPVPPGAHKMNGPWLKILIKDLLEHRRYLIVLDDAWQMSEWDAIKHALPNNTFGSRVMITTRNAELASAASAEFTGKVHNMEPLTIEQSWRLFCRKTFFPESDTCPPHLEEICSYILRKCDGLPLAIVAISGVLATKDVRRIDEWDLVRRSLRAEIDGNNRLQNLKKVLSLSFNDLPYYLKSCFLHLSVFPEGHMIDRKRLIRLWVAEGFVERKDGKSLEETAEGYFDKLLSRSLLQVAETTSDGRVKICRVHDILREIITSKSKDHNFAMIVKDQVDVWPEKVRRLSIQNPLQTIQPIRSLQLRSLYMFGVETPMVCSILGIPNKLLGVLDLQAAPITRFPTQVVDSYYLKYISLRHTEVKLLPKSIGKLQNLETLDLKHTNITVLPVEILKLQKLRQLLVYRYENISYLHFKYGFKALTEIGALQSLQKLCYIEVDEERSNEIMKEIGKLSQLSRLGILKLRKEDGRDLCGAIAKLSNLQALSVAAVEDDEVIDLQHLASPPQLLQRIYLRGRLQALPQWIQSLHSLMQLHLKWSRLKEDPLVALQGLPNLVHLELLQVYNGKTLRFKAKGFKKLRILGLDYFEELRCIEIEEGAMPCLEKLIIQRCNMLEKLPEGIEYLTNLKVLEFFDMPDALVRKVMRDEKDEDYKKVAHIPQVFYGYWRDGGWDVQSVERSAEGDGSPRSGTSMRSNDLPPCWK